MLMPSCQCTTHANALRPMHRSCQFTSHVSAPLMQCPHASAPLMPSPSLQLHTVPVMSVEHVQTFKVLIQKFHTVPPCITRKHGLVEAQGPCLPIVSLTFIMLAQVGGGGGTRYKRAGHGSSGGADASVCRDFLRFSTYTRHFLHVTSATAMWDNRSIWAALSLDPRVFFQQQLLVYGQVLALRAHCVHTAHAKAEILTQEYLSPV